MLPILGEFDPNPDRICPPPQDRTDGPAALRPPGRRPPAEARVAALLDEARLFFDYLREDYPAALKSSLETLEARDRVARKASRPST